MEVTFEEPMVSCKYEWEGDTKEHPDLKKGHPRPLNCPLPPFNNSL